MSRFFDGLERDLVVAAARRPVSAQTGPRRARASLLLAAALVLLAAGTAGAGTYLLLRAAPIAPFADSDVTLEQRVAPGTSRVLSLRAADPDRREPPWALRLARSRIGLLCGTVGQVAAGEFGIVGLDDRFRAVPEANADACSQEDPAGLSLLGTRVFAADRDRDVRTILNGVAGERVERVEVAAHGGRSRTLARSGDGAFLLALRGYPEDAQPVVTLHLAGGRSKRYALAASPFLALDPLGGGAWKVEGSVAGGGRLRTIRGRDGRRTRAPAVSCTEFRTARPERRHVVSPPLCGRARYGAGPERTLYFGARRLSGRSGPYAAGRGLWNGHPPRTALWGHAGPTRVREVVVSGPGVRRVLRPAPNGGILAVFDPKVAPESLRVEVRFRDGGSRRFGSSHGLVEIGGRP